MKSSFSRPVACAILLLTVAIVTIGGCDNGSGRTTIQRVIDINPDDDSCTPVSTEFKDCAEACEVNPLGCANDILNHVESPGFISRRQLNPGTIVNKPNIQSPMHGMFVTVWNNPQLNDAINKAIENPLDPIDMPDWSISAKLNNSPGITFNTDSSQLEWATVMYKIPGYCPERIFPDDPEAPCKGGEWFWFLYRGGFLSFDFDPGTETSIPSWGKAEDFCLDCHGAGADSDWLWITHDLVKRQQELDIPVSEDGHTPGDTGAAFCDDVTALSPDRPPDVLLDPSSVGGPELANRMFNCYSWKTFVALFWPAAGERGVPDTEKTISGGGPTVWETYKQTYETFQPGNPGWTLDGKDWNDPQPLPQECLTALEKAGIDPADADTYQVLNETHQAFGSQFNNLVDQNGNTVHYNVRFNRDEFEFIKEGGFADTGAYSYNGPLGINTRLFRFPDNTDGFTGEGATEVKSAWKILCTNPETCAHPDDPSRYFSRKVLIYTPVVSKVLKPFIQEGPLPRPTVVTQASCELADVGLVGFHIAAKTFWAPQWIWPTFEHIDNVPGNTQAGEPEPLEFSFYNPGCGNVTLEMCLNQRPGISPSSFADNMLLACCPNQQNIVNSKPDPGNDGDLIPLFPASLVPIQASRIDPIGNDGTQASVAELNTLFRGLLAEADSPLRYYVMVNSQWPLGGRVETEEDSYVINNVLCLDPDTPAEECVRFFPEGLRLRNSTIETYDMAYCKPDNEDIGNDPAGCTPENVQDTDPHQFSSGGCMNCHFSSGTDSSFIWADGLEEQVPLN